MSQDDDEDDEEAAQPNSADLVGLKVCVSGAFSCDTVALMQVATALV